MAKSGRLELGDNILRTDTIGLSSKTVTYVASKAIEFSEENAKRPASHTYRSLLFKFWTLCVFQPPFWVLGTTYDDHIGSLKSA